MNINAINLVKKTWMFLSGLNSVLDLWEMNNNNHSCSSANHICIYIGAILSTSILSLELNLKGLK